MVQKVIKPVQNFTELFADIIVHRLLKNGNNVFSTHLRHAEQYRQCSKETGLMSKLWKCSFCQQEVKFCSKIVGSGGRQPDPQKVMAIKGLQPAKTKTGVRQILVLFGYFCDHIPNYAASAHMLTNRIARCVPNKLPWTDVHTSALNQLKQALCKALE